MKTVMLITMAVVLTMGSLVGAAFAQAPPTPAEEQPEVLTRGLAGTGITDNMSGGPGTGLHSPVSGKQHQTAGRKKPPTQPNDEEKK